MRALILLPVIALAGCAMNDGPARQTALDDVPGHAVGKPVSCIQVYDVDRVEALNDYVALFHMRGKRIYRMDFPNSCRGLNTDAFRHTTSTGQYCQNDIITIFDTTTGMQKGSCGLNEFVPYEMPKSYKKQK